MNASAQPIRPGTDPKEIVALLKRQAWAAWGRRVLAFALWQAADEPCPLGRFHEGNPQGGCERAAWSEEGGGAGGFLGCSDHFRFYEVGPMKQIKAMMKRIDATAPRQCEATCAIAAKPRSRGLEGNDKRRGLRV